MSNVTRYLCAGAYLDDWFRDRYRAVAPSYGGCELVPIVHRCRRARTMLVVRDALITAVFAVGLWWAPIALLSRLTFLLPFTLLTADRVRHGSPASYPRVGPAGPVADALVIPVATPAVAVAYRIAVYLTPACRRGWGRCSTA
ncbi:hypothetical protein ACQEUU_13600 [Nonomuraea sp. CA-218870]|uniref:hypothetical protein n=1 Tax=Nonomuraea sp. CA-218870 TaxID=3239998 RepID=UPI003D9431AF